MYYNILITDFIADDHKAIEHKIKLAYSDAKTASRVALGIIAALAAVHGLDYEDQGDQYMAYYKEGHPDAGCGAFTAHILDEYGRKWLTYGDEPQPVADPYDDSDLAAWEVYAKATGLEGGTPTGYTGIEQKAMAAYRRELNTFGSVDMSREAYIADYVARHK